MGVPAESVLRTVAGDFADCRDLLADEIAERGIVLTFHSYVAAMLSRTADATGQANLYLHAEILGFCKADVSAAMLAKEPHDIIFCPQAVFIYELRAQPGIIHLAYRRALSAAAGAVATEALLADIIEHVIAAV